MRNHLRVLRAERRWSQEELGARVGVSRQTINAIETEKYDPSLPLAFRMAKVFDTTIENLFLGSDSSPTLRVTSAKNSRT